MQQAIRNTTTKKASILNIQKREESTDLYIELKLNYHHMSELSEINTLLLLLLYQSLGLLDRENIDTWDGLTN